MISVNVNTGIKKELADEYVKPESEVITETQSNFRTSRDKLLKEADIEVNKLIDNNLDATEWRVYRQALRDSTIVWILPIKPIL